MAGKPLIIALSGVKNKTTGRTSTKSGSNENSLTLRIGQTVWIFSLILCLSCVTHEINRTYFARVHAAYMIHIFDHQSNLKPMKELYIIQNVWNKSRLKVWKQAWIKTSEEAYENILEWQRVKYWNQWQNQRV